MQELETAVRKTLAFHNAIGRPLTPLEIERNTPGTIELGELMRVLDAGSFSVSEGFYALRERNLPGLERRKQDFLLDKKWRKLEKLRWLFESLPFVEFVLVAGSLALGNVSPKSDFDVIIGCKKGRIFIARLMSAVLFGVFGARRRRLDHKEAANNKVCFNHFVTRERYALDAPRSAYWRQLYLNLVPFMGQKNTIRNFFEANASWAGERLHSEVQKENWRFKERGGNLFRDALEFFLGGRAGDVCEQIVKRFQLRRIKSHLGPDGVGHKPRLRYDDNELEFHPDTRRIEEIEKQMTSD